MRKVSVILYVASSKDGYIADEKGGVEWLEYAQSNCEEDYGYLEFLESIGSIIMGEVSYKQLLDFGEWPYVSKRTYVFSYKIKGRCEEKNIRFVSGDVKEVLEGIKSKNHEGNIWLFGGANLIEQFYEQYLIDKYILTVVPFNLNKGIRLCEGILRENYMKLIGIITFPKGIKQKHYIRAVNWHN